MFGLAAVAAAIAGVLLLLLPGFLAFIVVPQPAERITTRLGPARALVASVLAAAPMALVIAVGGNVVVIGAAWLAVGVCWAAATPVEQALIAEASSDRLGRGMGLYGAARLGAACAVGAAVLVTGAAAVPAAVRRTGVTDPAPDRPSGTP